MPRFTMAVAKDIMGELSTLDGNGVIDIFDRDRSEIKVLPSLIDVDPSDSRPVMVVGDLHGDLDSLLAAVELAERKDVGSMVFLGDYVDRGPESLAVIWLVLGLRRREPESTVLLRGNHETTAIARKHGLYRQLEEIGRTPFFDPLTRLFSHLPFCAVIAGHTFAVHGGVPRSGPTLEGLRAIPRGEADPEDDPAYGMMWNDPDEGTPSFGPNRFRGLGSFYGETPVRELLDHAGLKFLVRSHQPVADGHHVMFGMVHTIFSCMTYGTCLHPKALLIKRDREVPEAARLPGRGL